MNAETPAQELQSLSYGRSRACQENRFPAIRHRPSPPLDRNRELYEFDGRLLKQSYPQI